MSDAVADPPTGGAPGAVWPDVDVVMPIRNEADHLAAAVAQQVARGQLRRLGRQQVGLGEHEPARLVHQAGIILGQFSLQFPHGFASCHDGERRHGDEHAMFDHTRNGMQRVGQCPWVRNVAE